MKKAKVIETLARDSVLGDFTRLRTETKFKLKPFSEVLSMHNIAEYIDFVKQQIEYQGRRATMTRAEPKKLDFHIEAAKWFRSLLQFLEESQNIPTSKNPLLPGIDPAGSLMPKELAGLPKELIDELSGGGIDKQELLIVELIDAAGGMLSLDRILIGIYKHTGEVLKRPVITAKLYRMAQNGMIFRVPKKKGIYTTESQPNSTEEQNAEDLI